jgi:hypothetical protein
MNNEYLISNRIIFYEGEKDDAGERGDAFGVIAAQAVIIELQNLLNNIGDDDNEKIYVAHKI